MSTTFPYFPKKPWTQPSSPNSSNVLATFWNSLRTLKLWILFLCWAAAWAEEPSALYLTWLHDPTTTMTVQWHSTLADYSLPEVAYSKDDETTWETASGTSTPLYDSSLLVHTVELTNLQPGATYRFRIDCSAYEHRFATLNPNQPIRFAVGGDLYHFLSPFKRMSKQIAKTDPDFVIIGGDIAYTHGFKTLFKKKNWKIKRWQSFFKAWTHIMKTSDGRIIPMLPILGNHDIRISPSDPEFKKVLFYQLFAMPEPHKSYRVLDVGTTLSLIFLDTAHHHPIEGSQAVWLQEKLAERTQIPFKLAAYHIAAFPSRYAFSDARATRMRSTWVPLFERYGLRAAFEHHNHTFKRTHPIKAGQVDPTGILYLGDGSWGVPPRAVHSPRKTWYLAKAKKTNCFWLTTLHPDTCLFQAFNQQGKLLDEFSLSPTNQDVTK